MDERIKNKLMSLNIKSLQNIFGKNLYIKEKLSKYSWFNLGGPAEIFFRPKNKDQLKHFLIEVKKNECKFHILGAGSNTLIRDSGVEGAVIKLGSKFAEMKLVEKDTIEVGAAALDKRVSDFAKKNEIGGMEFLSCIPGSIGGAVIMNSGCYGVDMSKIISSITIIDNLGLEKEIDSDEIKFYYRGSNLPKDYIILSAKLKGKQTSKDSIEKKQNDLIQKKKETQPSQIKTGGSTFKNINGKKAWMLIKESGCDKLYIGDAKISEKHCNFFVNKGKAKSSDIEKLIYQVKKEVKIKTGESLELEIKIIGNEK